ncbi:hypothetical protein VHEMI06998 [[Torrubiella] hemipterigena]|uniref:Uncharacterized protein n=1 Tax=[Torrubiella] hemipterigena TaxID=1531966 RepID=A0A0A1T280_9HYPO|nr:hypothetical protein VHEMI06998 [[Torrubiella] hemipterigena]
MCDPDESCDGYLRLCSARLLPSISFLDHPNALSSHLYTLFKLRASFTRSIHYFAIFLACLYDPTITYFKMQSALLALIAGAAMARAGLTDTANVDNTANLNNVANLDDVANLDNVSKLDKVSNLDNVANLDKTGSVLGSRDGGLNLNQLTENLKLDQLLKGANLDQASGVGKTGSVLSSRDGGLLGAVLGNDGLALGAVLPAGIVLAADLGPRYPPPKGCTNMWHPPHHGVDMDGCDNHHDDEWHYVHPCEVCQHQPPHTWTTSTISETCITTVISCAPTITNCPGRTTVTIPATTTICPVQVTQTAAHSTWSAPPVVVTQTPAAPYTTPCPTLVTEVSTRPTTEAPAPTGWVPPVNNNNTWSQPPVVVGAANKAQGMGIAAVVGAVAAMLL